MKSPVTKMIFEKNENVMTYCLGMHWQVTIFRADGSQETEERETLPEMQKTIDAGFYPSYKAGRTIYRRCAPRKHQPVVMTEDQPMKAEW